MGHCGLHNQPGKKSKMIQNTSEPVFKLHCTGLCTSYCSLLLLLLSQNTWDKIEANFNSFYQSHKFLIGLNIASEYIQTPEVQGIWKTTSKTKRDKTLPEKQQEATYIATVPRLSCWLHQLILSWLTPPPPSKQCPLILFVLINSWIEREECHCSLIGRYTNCTLFSQLTDWHTNFYIQW